jgi:hypothetical protein
VVLNKRTSGNIKALGGKAFLDNQHAKTSAEKKKYQVASSFLDGDKNLATKGRSVRHLYVMNKSARM